MSKVEAFGGPLDGALLELKPGERSYPVGYNCKYLGSYIPPMPGTEVTNADGLPIWHWHLCK